MKAQKYIFLIILFSILLNYHSFSQTEKQDVVYLKTGSIIKGKIVGERNAEKIKVESGQNLWVFGKEEIDRIDQELVQVSESKQFKNKGLFNITTIGLLTGSQNSEKVVSESITTSFGYHLNLLAKIYFSRMPYNFFPLTAL